MEDEELTLIIQKYMLGKLCDYDVTLEKFQKYVLIHSKRQVDNINCLIDNMNKDNLTKNYINWSRNG